MNKSCNVRVVRFELTISRVRDERPTKLAYTLWSSIILICIILVALNKSYCYLT